MDYGGHRYWTQFPPIFPSSYSDEVGQHSSVILHRSVAQVTWVDPNFSSMSEAKSVLTASQTVTRQPRLLSALGTAVFLLCELLNPEEVLLLPEVCAAFRVALSPSREACAARLLESLH